jgi:hypothetical protein
MSTDYYLLFNGQLTFESENNYQVDSSWQVLQGRWADKISCLVEFNCDRIVLSQTRQLTVNVNA